MSAILVGVPRSPSLSGFSPSSSKSCLTSLATLFLLMTVLSVDILWFLPDSYDLVQLRNDADLIVGRIDGVIKAKKHIQRWLVNFIAWLYYKSCYLGRLCRSEHLQY